MNAEQKNKTGIGMRLIVVLLVLNLLVSGGVVGYIIQGNKSQSVSVAASSQLKATPEYVLYIGLNDKDTYKQKISTSKAKAKVNKIVCKYVDGYTSMDAEGGWVDEKNKLTKEKSLVYMFQGAKKSEIKKIMDEVIKELNQNCVLVEKRTMNCTYYDGKSSF